MNTEELTILLKELEERIEQLEIKCKNKYSLTIKKIFDCYTVFFLKNAIKRVVYYKK